MEERFGHVETSEEYAKIKQEADDQYKAIREMSIDNDQILPNERTRHWMLAQTHILYEEGKDELAKTEWDMHRAGHQDKTQFIEPTEVDRARA